MLPALLLSCWQLACWSGRFSAYVLPAPAKVWESFIRMLSDGVLVRHIAVSFRRVAAGYGIAFILAFALAAFTSMKEGLANLYGPVMEFMRNVPPISLIALLILWFGIGERSKIIIIVLASFFPMFMNIKKGFVSCDKKLLEVGRSCHFSRMKSFLYIRLPYAAPDILVGMRIGLGYSWRAIIGAEMIAAGSGLGYLILDAQQMSRSDKVIVGIFVIGIVGVACDKLFSALIKRLTHGGVGDSWS